MGSCKMKLIENTKFKKYFIIFVAIALVFSIVGFSLIEVAMQKVCYTGLANELLCPNKILNIVYTPERLTRELGFVIGVRTNYFPELTFELFYFFTCILLIGFAYKNKFFSKKLIVVIILMYFTYVPLRNLSYDEVSSIERSIVEYDCPKEKLKVLNYEMFISKESSICKTYFYSGARSGFPIR